METLSNKLFSKLTENCTVKSRTERSYELRPLIKRIVDLLIFHSTIVHWRILVGIKNILDLSFLFELLCICSQGVKRTSPASPCVWFSFRWVEYLSSIACLAWSFEAYQLPTRFWNNHCCLRKKDMFPWVKNGIPEQELWTKNDQSKEWNWK